ncbi:MAG TPA: O-antigen ligase family protein, partial [Candidatus Eisenbacteria bacterium]|nr:O-antigen ligase family protein [Candidatus Eisenbacteria bacterium]
LVIYFLRPQEWSASLAWFRPVTLVMGYGLIVTALQRKNWSFRQLLNTPHDWAVLLFFGWVWLFTPASLNETDRASHLLLFYVVIVQALSSFGRISFFLSSWAVVLFWVAAMAVACTGGFDPLGSSDLYLGHYRGRLALNTSIFNNPNALGHSVIALIPMVYFLVVWKRPLFVKILSIPLFALPFACVYLTESKGSFLAGFASLLIATIFGRPKFVQAIILVVAFTLGTTALYELPRMHELNRGRFDEGSAGRLHSLTWGLKTMRENPTGIGWRNYLNEFTRQDPERARASHCAYNQVGAELGYTGLFLYLGIMYCCLRTLITMSTASDEEERLRRILFVMLITFMVSGWMIDFAYRASFFMTAATIAAFHRLSVARRSGEVIAEQGEEQAGSSRPRLQPQPIGPVLQPAMAAPVALEATNLMSVQPPAAALAMARQGERDEPEAAPRPGLSWTRLGLLDLALIWALTEGTVHFWTYIIEQF